ncbi:SRPBCC family protein [Rubritalea sp.]|uniref:SRPBCC family protein n=1 Tax=Rubritalea sp. TaxID=2109375 RepID=UPI003EF521F0
MTTERPTSKPPVTFLIVCGVALLYGLFARLLFASNAFANYGTIVSWSFICILPFAFGALVTFLGFKFVGPSTFWKIWAPLIVITLAFFVSIITDLEAVLCVIVAVPIMAPSAMIGGIIMAFLLKKSSGNLQISFIALLPFFSAPLENFWHKPHQQVAITDTIEINSPPEQVWAEIVSVPAIRSDELPSQWIYLLDFPKPIAAEIDHHRVGGKRLATFERDVSFFEVVTEFSPNKKLSFTIEADPEFIPHTAFDQHIIVGGRFYDVLDGSYTIEPTKNGCKLILTSNHRLSTPFNGYAGIWSKWTMNQIQNSILTVIKNRAESSTSTTFRSSNR